MKTTTMKLKGGNTATITRYEIRSTKLGNIGHGFRCTVTRASGEMIDEACFAQSGWAREWARGFNAHFE